ncbi:hypothetical protein AYM02_10765 (plasmid) [Coxiella burnetii]|uniref:hypothetical protein n=1 Tax=Coxiella burnetii TaxID=777 RepID=UPI000376062D|nr:hypothetical protein [Coxiella burnetii]AML49846.1 hypothetical protein AUR58_00015 [Coxiella burnetii]AML55746.1 hypothetical protein AYM38_10700 [Coxiella burnetii]ATN67773.1 hypothetical protein AYM00_11255 [Coxiella burnetii]ATN71644.1 hypothetical protein AYM02_10765 [Coxiella burnetii]ATN73527.1 hypothetical protein AYM11_10410 [Coxiella burnetii]
MNFKWLPKQKSAFDEWLRWRPKNTSNPGVTANALAANEYKRRTNQYQKLYEAADNYNEELRMRLKENGLPVN